MAALDAADMPADPTFREAVREHVEFGSRVAMQSSHAATDDELHPLREVPRWSRPAKTIADFRAVSPARRTRNLHDESAACRRPTA